MAFQAPHQHRVFSPPYHWNPDLNTDRAEGKKFITQRYAKQDAKKDDYPIIEITDLKGAKSTASGSITSSISLSLLAISFCSLAIGKSVWKPSLTLSSL